MYGVILKICSQIAICLKLDYNFFKLYIMMIPIWILLVQLIIYVSLNLLPKQNSSSRSQQLARRGVPNAGSISS